MLFERSVGSPPTFPETALGFVCPRMEAAGGPQWSTACPARPPRAFPSPERLVFDFAEQPGSTNALICRASPSAPRSDLDLRRAVCVKYTGIRIYSAQLEYLGGTGWPCSALSFYLPRNRLQGERGTRRPRCRCWRCYRGRKPSASLRSLYFFVRFRRNHWP